MGKGGGSGNSETTSHPIANRLEVLEVAETSGAAAGGLNNTVDCFDRRRGYPVRKECEDTRRMRLDGACDTRLGVTRLSN